MSDPGPPAASASPRHDRYLANQLRHGRALAEKLHALSGADAVALAEAIVLLGLAAPLIRLVPFRTIAAAMSTPIYDLLSFNLGTAAYLVKRSTAIRLIERLESSMMPCDYALCSPETNGLKIGQLQPAPFIQDNFTLGVTTLRSSIGERPSHRRRKRLDDRMPFDGAHDGCRHQFQAWPDGGRRRARACRPRRGGGIWMCLLARTVRGRLRQIVRSPSSGHRAADTTGWSRDHGGAGTGPLASAGASRDADWLGRRGLGCRLDVVPASVRQVTLRVSSLYQTGCRLILCYRNKCLIKGCNIAMICIGLK